MEYQIFVNLVGPLPDCNIGHRYQIIGILHDKWQVLYELKSGYHDPMLAREVGFQLLSENWQVFQNEMKELEKFYDGGFIEDIRKDG